MNANIPAGRCPTALLGIGSLGILLSYLFTDTSPARFGANLSLWFLFFLCAGLGCLFLVALEYIVSARWSIPLRRVSEHGSSLLFPAIPLGIAALYFAPALYPWGQPEAAHNETLLAQADWLNLPFISLRTVCCLILWVLFYRLIVAPSFKSDKEAAVDFYARAKARAIVFMLVFGVGVSLTGFDWLMTLEPAWFSTMSGVYLFAECIVSGLALAILLSLSLIRQGRLEAVRPGHMYNLGALLFAFTVFWTYIAYSQFMLIWYGNMPFEGVFYQNRLQDGWRWFNYVLVLLHFLLPFSLLLPRAAKSDPLRLTVAACCTLAGVYLSLYWFIFPALKQGLFFGALELSFLLFFAGLGMLRLQHSLRHGADMPLGDPRLKDGLAWELSE